MNKRTKVAAGLVGVGMLMAFSARAIPGLFATQLATAPIVATTTAENIRVRQSVRDVTLANKITRAIDYLSGIKEAAPTLDFGAIAANSCTSESFALTGVSANGVAIVNMTSSGNVATEALVSGTNTLKWRVCNETTGSQNPSSQVVNLKYFP